MPESFAAHQNLIPKNDEVEIPDYHARSATSTRQIGVVYQGFFMLACMVVGITSMCIKQLLLPMQVSLIDPVNTNTSFALVTSLGALAGLIASPVLGALSDRTTFRRGRRRPWIVLGVSIGVVGLVVMALATTIATLLIGEILVQIGMDTTVAVVTALIPDQVPERKKASTSALAGMAPIVGGTVGLLLVTKLTNTKVVSQGYFLIAGVSAVFIVLFLLMLRGKTSNAPGASSISTQGVSFRLCEAFNVQCFCLYIGLALSRLS